MKAPAHLLVAFAIGCAGRPEEPAAASATTTEPRAIEPEVEPSPPTVEPGKDDPHVVVFADRTSCAYLLLLEGSPKAPTREELTALVDRKLGRADEPEVQLLRELIASEPVSATDAAQSLGKRTPGAAPDLLGLHIEVLDGGNNGAVESELLLDPVLTRELTAAERASLAKRRSALLLRADYRNAHGVRGLRLLQTLVRLVASDRRALVHDPDTGETMGVDAFARRRLQVAVNVADQVMVIPFPDRRHGDPYVRLATRGMRRFGSVDLELDGLARDPELLQRATMFLYGLAYVMAQAGEADRSGYGVELEPVVTVTHDDVARAYRRVADLPKCASCPGQVELHLVERPTEGHDPQDHVVARVTAPREESDAAAFDQTKWAPGAIAELLGN